MTTLRNIPVTIEAAWTEIQHLRAELDALRATHYAERDELIRKAAGGGLLKPSEVMGRLGYRDRKAFFAMAKTKGLPMVRINSRVIRFDALEFERWQAKRAGKAA